MPFCPNPECPHIKKVGEPAEFRDGVANCSDCGVTLTDEVITAKKEKKTLNDFIKRLIYTLLIIAIWRAFSHIAIPGIALENINEFFEHTKSIGILPRGFLRFTVFSLGLMSYISAYVFVEILALFINPLKSWRANGYLGRIKLKRTALFATLFLALIQGLLIVNMIEKVHEGQLIHEPKWIFKIIIVLTLIAGVFISLWFAELITKKGIGHGIGVLILSSFAARIFYKISGVNINWEYLNNSPFEIILFSTAIFFALVALIIFFETCSRKIPVKFSDGTEAFMPLKLTTAGIIPAEWAWRLMMWSITFMLFINNSAISSIMESLIYAITIFLLYYFFTALFYRPQKMIDFLKSKNAHFSLSSEENVRRNIYRSLGIMAFWAALYLCVLVITPNILIKISILPVFLGGVALIEAVAISLDLFGEINFRRKNKKLIKVAEFHNVQMAGLCKSLLEQHEITCCLRGYYFRALLYFFGPYIEISAMVPEDKADEASELVKRYIEQ